MTLKEAKEILDKEGWCSFQTLSYRPKGLPKDDWEKPEVYEALKVCWDNHIMPLIKKETFDERKERLESGFYTGKTTQTKIGGMKDHEKVAQIVDKLIEEEGEPVNGEHLNTALHESAKEFNDALLDEQAKKIKDLEKKNAILNEKVVTISNELSAERFTNKVISKKNKKIASLKKSIKEKDDVIDTISEELRLSKVREEELIETVKDYLALVGDKDEEIKKLKKQLAKYKRGRFVKQKFMPNGAQYRDNHNFVVTEKPKSDIVIVKAPF